MLPANKHFTLVIGIDIHFTTIPPFNPIHPYIGLVFDIGDYIPFLGSTTFVNGVPRGASDTSGMLVFLKHFPIASGPFAMTPIIGDESTNFFGSLNTYAEGCRFTAAPYMEMTCNDIGIPLSFQPGKKFKPIPSLFAPTSFSIPLPFGAPVIVGGPYVPDWAAMLRNMIMGFGIGCLMKGLGKGLKKLAGKSDPVMNKKAANLMSGNADDIAKEAPKPKLKPGDKYPDWEKGLDYSDIQNPKTAGPNKPFTKSQKDQIYTKNRAAHDGYLVSDMDGTILESPQKSQKGVTLSKFEAQVDHVQPKSKGGKNVGENAQILSREQNRTKWDSS